MHPYSNNLVTICNVQMIVPIFVRHVLQSLLLWLAPKYILLTIDWKLGYQVITAAIEQKWGFFVKSPTPFQVCLFEAYFCSNYLHFVCILHRTAFISVAPEILSFWNGFLWLTHQEWIDGKVGIFLLASKLPNSCQTFPYQLCQLLTFLELAIYFWLFSIVKD